VEVSRDGHLSIADLRKICQTKHSDDFSANLVRKISIYVTYVLVRTTISANHVSWFNVALAVCSGYLLYASPLLGAAALILYTILDGVDGEVARYRKTVSLTGEFLDRLGGLVAGPSIFVSFGAVFLLKYDIKVGSFLSCLATFGYLGLRVVKGNAFLVTGKSSPLDEVHTRLRFSIWYITLADFLLNRQPGITALVVLSVFLDWYLGSYVTRLSLLSALGLGYPLALCGYIHCVLKWISKMERH